ncbi:hypothetical protein JCM16303_006725 [Sporobolomyces ruberrimus]
MPALPLLSATSPEDWRYLAEGGANLVLSYSPSDPSSEPSQYFGNVLRLRKRKKGGAALGGEADIEFGESIIQPLLDNVVHVERVAIDRVWLEQLGAVLEARKSRPHERREKDEIDLKSEFGFVAEDLVGGKGVLAFEIKPKWGFLPLATHLSPSSSSIKTTYCRFCMHRYYRSRSIDEHLEGYCPLDLYSRDEARIRKAVRALYCIWLESNGEANSFRIFHNGERITPDNAILVHTAMNPHPKDDPPTSAPNMLDLIADRLVPTLLASPVLPKLANLQSSLDPLDIEGLANLVSTSLDLDISDPTADLTRLGPQPSLEEWKTFLSDYSSSPDTTAERDVRHEILSYLLSATFKDCSIIISYSTDPETNGVETKVRAIDLDPKPIGKLGKWFELDNEIVECWGEMVEGLGEEERANLRKCNG